MSANYFAQACDYDLPGGWPQATAATNARFQPIETFAARFDALVSTIRELGFEAVDLWQAHLNWRWATPEHVEAARAGLARHGLAVASLAGSFGETPEELETACRLAAGVGTTVLGGRSALVLSEPATAQSLLESHRLRLGVENHGEHSPESMLALVRNAGDRIGTTLDTGWYAVLGHDVPQAIRTLAGHVVHVHLKDVAAPGSDVNCRLGTGCVPVDETLLALQRAGYDGGISIEHEVADHDPGEECAEALALVRSRWGP
jgi:sugar phosphate isomerase/epimerase